ncbi:MAG: hypothetical protein H7X95_02745, partial [Deltaproteobacteria bacterium]|nr:hypothetical protein [Deltaproteobacteria bacterium]
ACLAGRLVERGVRRLVIAGGETSGTVVKALHVKALQIGPEIAPGVPWTVTIGQEREPSRDQEPNQGHVPQQEQHEGRPRLPRLALALKSGNFGAADFFARALEMVS